VTDHRDVEAFNARAATYEEGRHGQLHRAIVERTADLALGVATPPASVLDVGCGTGALLRLLADRLPDARRLAGIDPATVMVEVARARSARRGVTISNGSAEALPFDDGSFDLVVSVTSFDHWADQARGLAECARVTAPGGRLVLVDQFSVLLAPILVGSRRGKARTRARAAHLLRVAGYADLRWHRLYAVIIGAVTARRPGGDPDR
jgi:ubiquinone/menaquinone biosynthesis C-methylase UbiE